MITKEEIASWFQELQEHICNQLEQADGKGKFKEDLWDRQEGGGGRTRILVGGDVIEKGGVNFSAVHGETPQKILDALKLEQSDFFATGVSIVQHPVNPLVPIIHMNVRYFEMSNGISWFGGGIDLTPHYINPSDAQFFHQHLKTICDSHDENYYGRFKQWADDYFFIKHRQETRGIGGIFFDQLKEDEEHSLSERWAFVKAVGEVFAPIYIELIQRNKDKPYTPNQKHWQKIRRGRYAEFNLVWDKGTKFGLDTNGRTESILMSMPPEAIWEYDFKVQDGSEEANTLKSLKKGVKWFE